MRNKRGGIADLISLSTATIIITVILILFVVFIGVVKTAEGIKNGEKIYDSVDVGVGDMKEYMDDYACLVFVSKNVKEGENVDDALEFCEENTLPQVLMGRHDDK